MKRFKFVGAVVLIMLLGFTGFSQEQNNTRETADELLGKFFEYFVKKDADNAFTSLLRVVEIDPTKKVYLNILLLWNNGNYAEALKLLEQRKAHSPGENEGKVIQILAAETHSRWARDLEKKYQYLDAIEHYKAAYVIYIIYMHRHAAIALNNIGFLYSALGQKQKALEYYDNALPIILEVGDRFGEAATLNNIGMVYDALGQKQKALEYYDNALPIRREVGDRSGEATTLSNIGMVYSDLGKKQKALEYFEKALPISREVRNRSGEASTLNNIGAVYDTLGQMQEALEYYEKALPIYKSVGDRSGEATTLNNIGGVYYAIGQKQKALEYYENALPIHREVGNRSVEAVTMNNIGSVYDALGQKQEALEYYENVLPIFQGIGDKASEAAVLSSLMFTCNKMNKSSLAIFYGKQSVNCYQQLRQHISGLEKDIKITYLKSREDVYRYLASLLVTAGRLPEAQYILDMLKGEEYFAYIRRDRDANSRVYSPIDFTAKEKKWLQKHHTLMNEVTAASSQYHELYLKPIKTSQDLQQLAYLEKKLTAGRKAYSQYLDGLKKDFFKYDKTKIKGSPETPTMIKNANALQTTLRKPGPGRKRQDRRCPLPGYWK